MKTSKFIRREFPIRAAQVTDDNFEQVARWCNGVIVQSDPRIAEKLGEPVVKYIKVQVFNPANERQTEAHVGDWVFKSGKTWKVYQDEAFKRTFIACEDDSTAKTFVKEEEPVVRNNPASIHQMAQAIPAASSITDEQAAFAAEQELQDDEPV